MTSDPFEQLRLFLDKIGATGMPKTASGVELKLLKKLFSPQAARAAVHLNTTPEPVEVIAFRMGQSPERAAPLLEKMAEDCLIRKIPGVKGGMFYAIPFAPGILELSVRSADEPYARDYLAYLEEGFAESLVQAGRTPITRTIPVNRTVATGQQIVPYEKISVIIEQAARPRAVTDCWCRKIKQIAGESCDKGLMEVCISFGPFARDMIHSKVGREIDDEEFQKIMAMAADAGLVPTVALNTRSLEDVLNLCNCCDCCCGILKSMIRLYQHELKGGQAPSSYFPSIDPDQCMACTSCVDKCPTGALHMEDDLVILKNGLCLGCGLCVHACPVGAIALIRRKTEEIPVVPDNVQDLFQMVFETKSQNV